MQIQTKLGGILYNRGGKPGSNYLALEVGMEFWNRVQVPGSDYKSLSQHDHNALRVCELAKLFFVTRDVAAVTNNSRNKPLNTVYTCDQKQIFHVLVNNNNNNHCT